MVIGVRRQAVGEVDAPAIQQCAIRGEGDEHRRIAVLRGTDDRTRPRLRSHHGLFPAKVPESYAEAVRSGGR